MYKELIVILNCSHSLISPPVRDGLGLGLGLGKQRRAPWTGQELENEDVDDDVALIARGLNCGATGYKQTSVSGP